MNDVLLEGKVNGGWDYGIFRSELSSLDRN